MSQQWTGLSVDESQFDKATHCRGEALKTHTVHDDTQALEQTWAYTHLYISLAWIPWSAEFLWWACAQTQSRTAVRIWCCPGWGSLPGWNPAWSPWALWHPGEPRQEEHWPPEQTNHIVCKCFLLYCYMAFGWLIFRHCRILEVIFEVSPDCLSDRWLDWWCWAGRRTDSSWTYNAEGCLSTLGQEDHHKKSCTIPPVKKQWLKFGVTTRAPCDLTKCSQSPSSAWPLTK